MHSVWIFTLGLTLAYGTALPAQSPKFREVVIDPEAAQKTCYAVTLADVDNDGDDDIVVVTESRVQWYANPTWEKHIILEGRTEPDNVCIAPYDIDRDGRVDFALGAGWTKVGTIQWISRGPEGEQWSVHFIAVEPWTHRMRWANVLGLNEPQLTVSPLNATEGAGVRLLAFTIPADPRKDRWEPTVIDDTLNRMHNHWHPETNLGSISTTITASQEGIHLLTRNDDRTFRRHKLGSGMPGESPASMGAGEVKPGLLENGDQFLATIEPMHGTSVVIYTAGQPLLPVDREMERRVLDDSLKQGHAIWCTNIDDDPAFEIVAGFREASSGEVKGPGIFVYDSQNPEGTKWNRTVIDDGGMACEDLLCADLNGDGREDIVAVGRATKNVKLYLNMASPKPGSPAR